MLYEVLQYINDYRIDDYCDLVEIETDGLLVSDVSKFIANQYILIMGSKLNDGVYQITSIVGNKLMVSDLLAEVPSCYVYGLAIPRQLLSLVSEIEAYNLKSSGVASESLGDYSVNYGNENGDVSWIVAYRKRLAPFRKVYLNIPRKSDDPYHC